jgi:hypothetical protein
VSTTLYSVARRDPSGSRRYWDIVVGASQEQTLARLEHDGVERAQANQWVMDARHSVARHLTGDGELATRGDLFEHFDMTRFHYDYKVVAVQVHAPNASVLRA